MRRLIYTIFLCFATLAISKPCNANDPRLDRFLDALAFARAIEQKCTTWTVDPTIVDGLMALLKMRGTDILPGGRYWNVYGQLVLKYVRLAREKPEDQLCMSAAFAFGPNGLMVPNLMQQK